jgi:hypothetical protein
MHESYDRVVALADKVGLVMVEVPGQNGLPMLACARRLAPHGDGCVALTDWCAPGLVDGLLSDGRLAVVVWDEATGGGYQLWGACIAPPEAHEARPGEARRLTVRVEQVVAFGSEAAHRAAGDLALSASA